MKAYGECAPPRTRLSVVVVVREGVAAACGVRAALREGSAKAGLGSPFAGTAPTVGLPEGVASGTRLTGSMVQQDKKTGRQ